MTYHRHANNILMQKLAREMYHEHYRAPVAELVSWEKFITRAMLQTGASTMDFDYAWVRDNGPETRADKVKQNG